MADVIHDRLLRDIDWVPTQINSLTASTPSAIRTPVHFSTDRECLERIMPTVGKFDMKQVTIAWIRNTMELSTVVLSDNLLDLIRANPALEIEEGPFPIRFDGNGDLEEILAEAEALQSAH
jgi:hypothetical protein